MSNKEMEELSKKIKRGLEIAEKRMLEEKALRGQNLIISSDDKTIRTIPAKSLLAL